MTHSKTLFTLLALLTTCLLFSCKEEIPPGSRPALTLCGVENALIETERLDILTQDGMPDQLSIYTYLGDTVLVFSYCDGCADGSVEVYSCAGESVCTLSGFAGPDGRCPDWETEAEFIAIVWEQ